MTSTPSAPSAPWLTLIGIGEDGSVSAAGREALARAHVVYGGARHLALCDAPTSAERRVWPSPFAGVYDALAALKGTPVAILATGDPQWYGIGSALAAHLDPADMLVLPSPSAFQLAAARLHWPLQEVTCLSLHGRPVEMLNGFLQPGRRILTLTSNGDTPAQVAHILTQTGFGASRLTVLNHMGGAEERIGSGLAESWDQPSAEFNTVALELIAQGDAAVFARVPGLPDTAFRHDGKMTKREVRAVTLAALAPLPGDLLWDVGSGCGSIAIEWMRAGDSTRAIGLDPHAERRLMARENALALGVPGLDLRDTAAPEGLQDLPDPDAIFIGGGLTAPGIVEACLARLKPGGRLVANAVTLEGEAVLLGAHERHGGELIRLSVQRADKVGGLTGWRPMMPVTQWQFSLPRGGHFSPPRGAQHSQPHEVSA
ncbi:precorrin-6y C5,15-methyltransferase (decarboxylating) subunit CbiE [Roseibium aestuarii]|uniref:Precorrin-6y C5,15-methyltransferase (Decarboxylating) subunit CbiE n=1 Tax=Roseibium aestuarii TaxID=2600299 RepID=A0ABW4JVA4_9HYPH|nr:precorrin-6y C5,15-methyltransferase (decarboxylating) subunit CbiE [Roseibium aestuarii]